MRILHAYVLRSYAVSFALTLCVITFVMSIGILFRITDLLSRGVQIQLVLDLLAYGIPTALTFALPVSALMSSLLVFGRMSADGEITAMKACGVGLWQIVSPCLLSSVVLSIFCLHINNELSPEGHFRQRTMKNRMGAASAVELIEAGRFIQDFPGLIMYIGNRRGENVRNVRIYDLRNPKVKREIQAATGKIHVQEGDLMMELLDVRIDPMDDKVPGAGWCDRSTVRVGNVMQGRPVEKKKDDMSLVELVGSIREVAERYRNLRPDDLARQRTSLIVELNKRLALSASCFAFVLLGIPLGIKTHRKESSVGVAMSLFLVFNFYLFVIAAESLVGFPQARPELIIWFPVVVATLLGMYLVRRAG